MKKRIALLLVSAICVSTVPAATAASQTFTDVPEDSPYSQAIQAAVEQGFMGGYGEGKFGPDDSVTRAQIVQVLYNKYGEGTGTDSGFTDVAADMWYAKAVTWAVRRGVVSGYGNGKFGPDDTLTREQIATIFYNFAGRPEVDGDLNEYTDMDSVDGYAVVPMIWAIKNGIVAASGSALTPDADASRGQVALAATAYHTATAPETPEAPGSPEAVDPPPAPEGTEPEPPSGSSTPSVPETPETPVEPEKPVIPEQPEVPTTPESPAEPEAPVEPEQSKTPAELLIEQQDEQTQKWLNKYELNTITSSSAVNATIPGCGKRDEYPTLGRAIDANQNGYHTEATLDLTGCVLDYEGLALINEIRNSPEVGVPRGNAGWVISDYAEEVTMGAAKYQPSKASMCVAVYTEADSLEEAINTLYKQGLLDYFISTRIGYMCVAHYTDGGKTVYAVTGWNIGEDATAFPDDALDNYYVFD